MAVVKDSIAGLYITYFNRAPDEVGLDYWETQAKTVANNNTTTLLNISKAFSQNSVAITNYPSNLSHSDFVAKMYTYALNRTPDAAGKAYWETRLAAGVSHSDLMVEFINAVLDYDANADKTSTTAQKQAAIDAQGMVKNKIAAGILFAANSKSNVPLDANGNPDTSSVQYIASQDVLNGINQDSTTMDTAFNKLMGYYSSLPNSAYAVFAYQTVANEGATATFKLNTTNLSNGAIVAYTLSGNNITAADVVGGLSGNVTITENTATIFVKLALDATLEGNETINIGIPGQTLVASSTPNTIIIDTGLAAQSLSPDSPIHLIGVADMPIVNA